MRASTVILALLSLASLPAGLSEGTGLAQQSQAPPRPVMPAQDGGVREVLESIVVPPIPNAPFSATLATEWARSTAGGATITFVNQRHIARDASGRIYEERWALVPKGSDTKSRIQWIQIADPSRHTLFNCNMLALVCDLLVYDPAPDLAAATPPPSANGPLRGNRGFVQTESLGNRILDGANTTGTRVTITLNPGVMGNDQPVTQLRETWRDDALAINLLSIRSGPLIGTQTFTVTELDPNPPDAQLFEPPAGFQIRDRRAVLPPSQ